MSLRRTLIIAATVAATVALVIIACNTDNNSPVTSGSNDLGPVCLGLVELNETSHLVVSNQTSSSVSISWVSEDSVDACVYYGLTTTFADSVVDATVDDIHYATLTGLMADTTYYFEVRTGTEYDSNGGSFYAFNTAKVGAGVPYVVYQTIYLDFEYNPMVRSVAFVTVKGSADTSSHLSCLTDTTGFWYVNLGNLKDASTGEAFSYTTGDTIFVDVLGASDGDISDTVLIDGTSPQDLGEIYMCGCDCMPGDANGDGKIDKKDVTYLTDFLRKDGPAPVPYAVCSGDADCNCKVDSKDITYLRQYTQFGGPAPCSCEEWQAECGPPQ